MSQKRSFVVKVRAFTYVAGILRFSFIILAAGLILLTVNQGQDLLVQIMLGEAPDWSASISLLGGVTLWAFSLWYTARVLLDIRFPDPPVDYAASRFWRTHQPRLLGLLAFAGVIANLLRAAGWQWEVTAAIALALVFYLVVALRRVAAQKLSQTLAPESPTTHWAWAESAQDLPAPRLQSLRQIFSRMEIWILLLLGLVPFVYATVDPLGLGLFLNTPLLFMLWGSTILPLGSALTFIGNRTGFPVFTALFLLALLFSLSNDNHRIRPLSETNASPASRAHIEEAVDSWIEANCRGNACPPFVVVATAGGGIRAGYWTATVLGELYSRIPRFNERLFAISGVSGGAVGATVYRAAVEAGVPGGEIKEKLQAVLGRDYLTPISTGLLYPDLLQRFLPTPLFEDRASIFERSLERGFFEVIGQDTLNQSFSALSASGERPWPAIFLNSTWSENGRRIVAAGLDLSHTDTLYTDLLDSLGYDMRLSTAAHNSARFPFVSPPGSWRLKIEDPALRKQLGRDEMVQRLQDGGLFENYGAETAMEILKAARHRFKLHPTQPTFDPLVILISSDPGLPDNLALPDLRPTKDFGYELMTSLRTFSASRSGRGALAAAKLRNWIRETVRDTRYAHFRMCGIDEHAEPPLGWALSPIAQTDIQGYLPASDPGDGKPCRQENWLRLKTMVQQIGTEPAPVDTGTEDTETAE